MYFDPDLATDAAGLATQSAFVHHPGEGGYFPYEAYLHTVWLADDNNEVSILVAPLWQVQIHGTPLSTGSASASHPCQHPRHARSPSRYRCRRGRHQQHHGLHLREEREEEREERDEIK